MKNSKLSSCKRPKKIVKNSLKVYRKALKSKNLPVDKLLHDQNQCNRDYVIFPDEMQIFPRDGGVFFGLNQFDSPTNCTHFIGKSQKEDGHILVIGSPGCHKTSGIVLPSILTWQGTFVAVDIKGDISSFCSCHSKDIAYPVRVIDFSGESDWHYDPFLLLRTGGENNLISNARDLALAIIPLPNNVREPFWVQGAQNILTAIILYAFGHNMHFNEMIQMALTAPIVDIQKAIEGSDNTTAKMFISQYSAKQSTHFDGKTLQGSFIEMTNHLLDFYQPFVQNVFSSTGNSVDWANDIFAHNFVIRIPESKLNQWGGAVRLILRQLFSALSNRPEKHSLAGRCQPPLLLLWDELPRFGKFEDLVHAFSTLRSRDVTICATVQSLAQLDLIYGTSVRRALVDCCTYVVIGTVQDTETQQYCSTLIGSAPVWEPGVGENFYPAQKEFAFSRNLSLTHRPILFPENFSSLNFFVISTPFGKYFVEKFPLFERPRLLPVCGCECIEKSRSKTLCRGGARA